MIHVLQLPIHINDEQMDLNDMIYPLIKAEDFISASDAIYTWFNNLSSVLQQSAWEQDRDETCKCSMKD